MNKHFAIIRESEKNPDRYRFCGTGFFINESGAFTSAAHVLRNAKNTNTRVFICFPINQELVPIFQVDAFNLLTRRIYNEPERTYNIPRSRDKFQCGYEFKDIAVGTVNLSDTPYYDFEIRRPSRLEELYLLGFQLNKDLCPQNEFSLIEGKFDSGLVISDDKPLEIKGRLNKARIPYLHKGMQFEKIDLYNNCLDVYGNVSQGNSGAPVINKFGKVSGMIVAGNKFDKIGTMHLSKYISKKTVQLLNF